MADDSDSSFALDSSCSTSDSPYSPPDSRPSDVYTPGTSTITSSSTAMATSASVAAVSSASMSTPSRKRKRNTESWQKNKRKLLRNAGKEYVSAAKKMVSFLRAYKR